MGFRMRKSIKLAPGVRLNVSKRGLGVSAGVGGARYSVHSSGRRTVSARTGIPGITYRSTTSSGGRRRTAPRQVSAPSPPATPKPGLFAPKGEKQLVKAIKAENVEEIKRVGDEHADYVGPSYALAGLMLVNDRPAEAKALLEKVFSIGSDPAQHSFMQKYFPADVEIKITEGVTAHLSVGRDAVGLALAELYQADGEIERATDTVEQLDPTTYAAVSLAELYTQASRYDNVVELTEGIANKDDASALLLVFRGVAFRELGFHDAAHEALKESLRSRSRTPTIRHHALFERAQNYKAQGKKAMARKDLERILAEDSDYGGVRDQLAELAQ
jgi:tetratricopeptide (TPR) repeat protein